ncbi:FkbM family methyltransferase (plasmid) [Salipiger sp. H15]|uniref:FkbM family methyltransferase n=1 Tax=Alloyangia sp. H15 TaxID=3029062 RepID=A0AAU8AR47_9RHOB
MITPVGPGHAEIFSRTCGPSVEKARAYDTGPFSEVLHYVMDDTAGRHGRSARRNEALQRALDEGIDWVFFLDADDRLTPNAFEAFGRVIAAEPGLDVVWGLICTVDPGGEPALREGQPATLDSREDYLAAAPFHGVQIGGFYRAAVAAKFGFDTAMDTGEDYKFYCQLWAEARCAKRPEIFFLNHRGQHSTGPRSATGADWNRAVTGMWIAELGKAEVWTRFEDAAGRVVRMRLTNPADPIQNSFLQGRFFDQASLEKLGMLVEVPAPRIVDVGAKDGNHVLWYARNLQPARIFPVEPKPAALERLAANIEANGIADLVDRRGLGLRVGEGRQAAFAADAGPAGAARWTAPDDGAPGTCALDDLLEGERVDFIRIDAEGAELEVLDGAAGLIARDRPVIWIAVLKANAMHFLQGWCRKAGYRVVDSTFHLNTTHYFVVPKEAP